jgi:hypothetical protein
MFSACRSYLTVEAVRLDFNHLIQRVPRFPVRRFDPAVVADLQRLFVHRLLKCRPPSPTPLYQTTFQKMAYLSRNATLDLLCAPRATGQASWPLKRRTKPGSLIDCVKIQAHTDRIAVTTTEVTQTIGADPRKYFQGQGICRPVECHRREGAERDDRLSC